MELTKSLGTITAAVYLSLYLAVFSGTAHADADTKIVSREPIQQGAPLWTNRRSDDGRFWEIPYKIHHTFGSDGNPADKRYFDTLNTVIESFESTTCLRFKRIPADEYDIWPFMRFQNINGKCSSRVGRAKGTKTKGQYFNQINLNSICRKRTMGTTHEIHHALGFNHAIARPDRDDYLTIHWEHVKEGLMGCYEERRLTMTSGVVNLEFDAITVDDCRKECLQKGYYIFGIQAPSRCFCAPSWKARQGRVDASYCPDVCDEVENQFCGGDGFYSVYNIKKALPKVKKDNAVGFPMDPQGVQMGGSYGGSRYGNRDPRKQQFPTITYKDGSTIERPRRVGLSETDIETLNAVYGCEYEEP